MSNIGVLPRLVASLAGFAIATWLTLTSAVAETFTFVALGDMPYGDTQKTMPRLRTLVDVVNKRKPAFSLHVGDFKSGSTPCSDAVFQEQLDLMKSFQQPLVFTPGDNDWTDCHRKEAGGFDPIERLSRLRSLFFTAPESLGAVRMALERQSDIAPEYKTFVENARFSRAGVHVVTVHVVGSNNGLEARDRRAANEFFDRDQANVAWLRSSFAKAAKEGAKAVVIAMQADMFEYDFGNFGKDEHLSHSGFANVADALVQETKAFGRPVLLIHGDTHNFRVTTPFRKRAPAMLALQVFGADQMHAVEITVDTDDPAVFAFRPIWNKVE